MSKRLILFIFLSVLLNSNASASEMLDYSVFGYQCGLSVMLPSEVAVQLRKNYRLHRKSEGKPHNAYDLANFYPIVRLGEKKCNIIIPEDKVPFESMLLAWLNRGVKEKHLTYNHEERRFDLENNNSGVSNFSKVYLEGIVTVFGYKIDDPDLGEPFNLYLLETVNPLNGPLDSPDSVIDFNGKHYKFNSVRYYYGYMLDSAYRLIRDSHLAYNNLTGKVDKK